MNAGSCGWSGGNQAIREMGKWMGKISFEENKSKKNVEQTYSVFPSGQDVS